MQSAIVQHRPTTSIINLENLKHNLQLLRSWTDSKSFFCPMVKANAYGHGDVEISQFLAQQQVQSMGVGLIEEGVLLRQAGIKNELLFFGLMDKMGAQACLDYNLTPVLSSWDQVQALKEIVPSGSSVGVHLKFDTGMKRLGFESDQLAKLLQLFQDEPKFRLSGVMTHLHSAEDASDPKGASFHQLREFRSLSSPFARWTSVTHTLNSAGLMNLAKLKSNSDFNWGLVPANQGSRPGLALYGVSPLAGFAGEQLKPVMSFRSKIIRVRKAEAGDGVSYGHRWKSSESSWLGVVPVGYADGYHRMLSNRANVLVDGHRVPLVGNVCMDYFMIDLTKIIGRTDPASFLWKEVTLFGYDSKGNLLDPNELAEKAMTIPWEILTSVSERVPRVFQGRTK